MVRSVDAMGGATVVSEDWLLPKPAESSIFRALPEGGVLFSTASEVYFGLNSVGARIWNLLPPATRSFNELCVSLTSEYADVDEETIRGDAREFVEHLVTNGLAISPSAEETSSDASRS
ncbi:MAG: PqqD family protein [Gemmatimonadaceae bacterium]